MNPCVEALWPTALSVVRGQCRRALSYLAAGDGMYLADDFLQDCFLLWARVAERALQEHPWPWDEATTRQTLRAYGAALHKGQNILRQPPQRLWRKPARTPALAQGVWWVRAHGGEDDGEANPKVTPPREGDAEADWSGHLHALQQALAGLTLRDRTLLWIVAHDTPIRNARLHLGHNAYHDAQRALHKLADGLEGEIAWPWLPESARTLKRTSCSKAGPPTSGATCATPG